jgi:amino acid transporter
VIGSSGDRVIDRLIEESMTRRPDDQMTRFDDRLVRAIDVRRLTASIVNVTIGAGIFVLPAAVAIRLGPAAPLAYGVCAGVMALIATCFAAAGSRVSHTGGLYAYTERAFGPYAGFLAGVLSWFAAAVAVASVANAFVGAAGVVWPGLSGGGARIAILIAMFVAVATVNVRGVAGGAGLVELLTVAKLVPLVAVIAAGLARLPIAQAAWPALPPLEDLGGTAVLLFFAFAGLDIALVPGGEIRRPSRTVPIATFGALAITTIVYVLVQAVTQAALGSQMAAHAAAPIAGAASLLLGPTGGTLVLAGTAVSMAGYVSGDMLGTPRSLFALAHGGFLPARVGAVHPVFRTPWNAILVHAAIVCVMAISSSFEQLALLTSVSTLVLYLLGVGASWELQRRDVRADGEPLRVPGGPVVASLAACAIVWLLGHATWREHAVMAVVVACASALYRVRRYNRF